MPITNSVAPPAVKKPAATAKPVAVSKLTEDRRDALNGLLQLAQVPLIAMGLYADSGAVGAYGPGIARELALLAEKDKAVAAAIDPLIKIGPYTGLVAAVLPLILQIGVNHGRIPPGTMGTVSGDMLTAQVQAELAQVELAALTAQRDAKRAADKMRADIAEEYRLLSEDAVA
jgi:hypothetical protein